MRFESTASRVSASGAWRSITSSQVRFASSIIAHGSPRTSTPARSKRSGSTRRSSLPSSVIPSDVASRRAGSIVSTATRRPRAAISIAIAAAVVVLPTPPAPAQMQTRRLSSRSASTVPERPLSVMCRPPPDAANAYDGARRASSYADLRLLPQQLAVELCRETPEGFEVELRLPDERQRHDAVELSAQPPQLRPLRARAVVLRERGLERARQRRRPVAFRDRREVLRVLTREALGQQLVHDRRLRRHVELVAELGDELERLGDRPLLRDRDRDDRRPVGVAEEVADVARLAANRPDARDVPVRLGRLQQPEAVAGRGRVDDREVVRRRLRVAAGRLRELPHLPDRRELPDAWRGGDEVLEDPVAREHAPEPGRAGLVDQVLLERELRVDRHRVKIRRQLRLRVADALAAEHLWHPFLLRHFADDRAQAAASGGEAERGRDGRLADASLAGNEEKPLVEQPEHRKDSFGLIRIGTCTWVFSLAGPKLPTTPGSPMWHRPPR